MQEIMNPKFDHDDGLDSGGRRYSTAPPHYEELYNTCFFCGS